MALDKVNDCRFLNDSAQAERSAREQLKFILANINAFSKIRNGGKYSNDAKDMNKQSDNFTPAQLSYIDGIYEKTMKGLGFDSFTATYKPKRKFV